MSWFQSVLGWTYLFLCFVLVWYFVSVVLFAFQWITGNCRLRKLAQTAVKLLGALAVTRLVIWLGMYFPHL